VPTSPPRRPQRPPQRPAPRRSAAEQQRHRARALITVIGAAAAVVTLILAAAGQLPLGHHRATAVKAVPALPAPWEYTVPAWSAALGGDTALTAATYRSLNAYSDPHLSAADRAALSTTAAAVEKADLTGAGRATWPAYWPPAAATGKPAAVRCSDVAVLAASPAALATVSRPTGTDGYAKVLVASTGHCTGRGYTRTAPLVEYVYFAHHGDKGWMPVRDWQIPAPPESDTTAGAADEPADWQLATFTCGAAGHLFRDRILVVDAFTQMCTTARAAGVNLQVTAAYRTRGEQAALFQTAVKQYGSVAAAKRWVAYADADVCDSRHCSGLAINVTPTASALGWLEQTAGCLVGTSVRAAASCPDDATAVPRMARYGFAEPLAQIPGYLEFTLPTATAATDPTGQLSPANCDPAAVPVPNQVASIFRCRLARAGVYGAAQQQVVEQALVVSRCESGWNSAALAFGGKFATVPNPADGKTYTQAGVFMISAKLAAAGWVPGGAKDRADPVANINAAASLWLATRGWEQFGCATGTTGGFETGPVLPAFGGPALPAWAAKY